MFDFYNNSYTFITGLFTVIFGMAFPLILQCIQRIDEKYNSSVISQEFENEVSFKLIKWLLYPYLFVVCLSPLFLGYVNAKANLSYIIHCFMLIYILAIAVLIILLFSKIMVYYNLNYLVESLQIKNPSKKVLVSFDLARYASRKGYQDAYIKAMVKIAECIMLEQRNTKKGSEVIYSENVRRVLAEIGKTIGDFNSEEYGYKFDELIDVIYDKSNNTYLSDSTYKLLWFMLNNAAMKGDNGWIKNYWTWTTQYYSYISMAVQNKQTEEFYKFNVMLGALLVFNKRYECLYHIMTFTQSQPANFPLIPDTLGKILLCAGLFESMLDKPLEVYGKYTIQGLDHGINNDTDIISEAYRYLALLIIRIWSYQDYNYTYSNPLTVPQADYDNADINEKRIFILKRLKKYAIEWLDSDVFKYIRFNNIPKIDDVKKILDDCANECKKMNQEIDGREGYDEQKLKRITDEATRVNYENYITIPSQTDLPPKESLCIDKFIQACNSVERRFLQKGRSVECGGIGNFLAEDLYLKYKQEYIEIVRQSFNISTENINRNNLQEYLDRLSLTQEHVIIKLTSGLKISTDALEYDLGRLYCDEFIIICEKKYLPSLDFIEIQEQGNFQIIDEYNYLYFCIEEHPDIFMLYLGQTMRVIRDKKKRTARMIKIT